MQAHTISGIHHITAIAGDPQRNLDFYTALLGLRLVKLAVNFDDPGTYHFYFGNASGTPGSILTFFPWPGARRGTVGTGQVTATTFAIPHGSAPYWRARLSSQAVAVTDAGERFGEAVIATADPDGLPLEFIATRRAKPELAWTGSTVDREHAICGFHGATISEEGYEQTARLLTATMGLSLIGSEGTGSGTAPPTPKMPPSSTSCARPAVASDDSAQARCTTSHGVRRTMRSSCSGAASWRDRATTCRL